MLIIVKAQWLIVVGLYHLLCFSDIWGAYSQKVKQTNPKFMDCVLHSRLCFMSLWTSANRLDQTHCPQGAYTIAEGDRQYIK